MRLRSYGILFTLILATIPTGNARAYVRAKVADTDDTYLYWPIRNLNFAINENGVREVDINSVVAAVKRAFRHWDGLGCTDLNVSYDGVTTVEVTNMTLPETEQPDRTNLVLWREDAWPPPDSEQSVDQSVVALTTLVYDRRTGQIIDADIDVNGFHYQWFDAEEDADSLPPNVTDIENVLTHEAGHFFGLAHSESPDASMWWLTPPGELSKRTLSEDDEAGICEIYPAGEETPLGINQLPNRELIGGCTAIATDAPLLPWLLFGLFAPIRARVARRRRP